MKISIVKHTYVVSMGVFFALLQTCYFFQLEIWLTAAYPTFLTIMLGWLVGNVVGLRLYSAEVEQGQAQLYAWLFISVVAYYITISGLNIFPYRMEFLTVYGFMIGASGVLAGRFFAINRELLGSSARLFFMENNGFVIGWAAGFIGFVWYGHTFNYLAPALLGTLCAGLTFAATKNH